jgi:hypothetical protein
MSWNGIGIGWPNASSQTGSVSGWFYLAMACGPSTPVNTYTVYQENTNYKEGDFVYCIDLETRIMLGPLYTQEPEGAQVNVSGPAYNSCGI